MRRQLFPALRLFAVCTVALGIAYPLAVTGLAQGLFSSKANGSLLRDASGQVIGSRLLGQGFSGPEWLQPRPSAAGSDGYDGAASGASNLGPSNPQLEQDVAERAAAYRRENDLPPDAAVPSDAVTASGSGLDPDISLTNATLQAPRIARARHLPLATVLAVLHAHEDRPTFGLFGEPGVNVLEADLALARLGGVPTMHP